MSTFMSPSQGGMPKKKKPETAQERQLRIARGRPAEGLDALAPPTAAPRTVTPAELRQGFPMPAQREQQARDMGPPTPAQAAGPPRPTQRPAPTPGSPFPATSQRPVNQPAPANNPAVPVSSAPAGNTTRPGPMGPPDRYASNVQQGAQEFRTRRALADQQLTERGIDPAAAREQLALTRMNQRDPRALRQQAIALRSRGDEAGATRLIEQAMQADMAVRDQALDSQLLRNPGSRADQMPGRVASIRIAQERSKRMGEVDATAFEAGARTIEENAGFEVLNAQRNRRDAETGLNVSNATADQQVEAATARLGADVSSERLRGDQAESARRILDSMTNLNETQLTEQLEMFKATADPRMETAITEAQNALRDAQDAGSAAAARARVTQILGQMQEQSATRAAARQPMVEDAADVQAQTAVTQARTQQVGASVGEMRAQAEQTVAAAELPVQIRENLTALGIRNIGIAKAEEMVKYGADPSDPEAVGVVSQLTGPTFSQVMRMVKDSNPRGTIVVTGKGIDAMQNIEEAVRALGESGLTAEGKTLLAAEIIAKMPDEIELGRINPAGLGPAVINVRRAAAFNKSLRNARTMLEELIASEG